MKNDEWVCWQKLCNVSSRKQPVQVVDFLRSEGYMEPDGFLPTNKAEMDGLSKRQAQAGRIVTRWNKTRYMIIAKACEYKSYAEKIIEAMNT